MKREHRLLVLGGPVVDVDDDRLADPELLPQDPLRQRVLDQLLDGSAQRARTQLRVVAALGEEGPGGRGQLDGQALAGQLLGGRESMRSTISMTSSRVSSWKTITSSIRLRNSGRKWAFRASLTLAFIRS